MNTDWIHTIPGLKQIRDFRKRLRDEQAESDAAWEKDKNEHGYALTEKAAWYLRLPVVRHVRHFYLALKLERHVRMYGSIGIGFGGPNQYDLWVLYAIFRGWC